MTSSQSPRSAKQRLLRWVSVAADKRVQQITQGFLLLFWLVMIYPSVVYWKESVPYLVFISVYTIVMEHLNAFLTAMID